MSKLTALVCLLVLCASTNCSKDNPVKPIPGTSVVLAFDAPISISSAGLGGALSDMAVGDFDADGHLDVAIGMIDSSKVWVSYGTGGGAFGAAKTFRTGTPPASIHAMSLESDAPQDLIVGGIKAITILRGTTAQGFSGPDSLVLFGGDVKCIASADFDRDGLQDFAVVIHFPSGNGDQTDLFLFAGNTLDVSDLWTTPGDFIATGDVSGDTYPDVVVTNSVHGGTLSVFKGAGNGSLSAPDVANVGSAPPGPVALADLETDGGTEIGVGFAADPGLFTVRWQATANPLVLNDTYAQGFPVASLATGDLNLDGHADFAAGGASGSDVLIFVNNWHGKLLPPHVTPAGGRADQLVIADLDGDGKKDIVLGYLAGGGVLRYLKNTSH